MRRGGLAVVVVAVAAATAGFTPFRAEEPEVREGNERVAAGAPAAALPRYDAAERAVGPRAEIDYDRGVALLQLGRSAEARDAFRRALARGAGELGSRAQQNLATALEATGDREGAIAAFSEALRADPGNEDARFDLEVLLRRKQAEARRQDPPERPQSPQASAQGERGVPGGAAQAPKPGANERRPASASRAEDRAGAAGKADADPRGAPGAEADPERLSQDDAARILDAFRVREQAMPLPGAGRETVRRGDADPDW